MLVITENGIFIRWAPRCWYLWWNGLVVMFGEELPALIAFLEHQTNITYANRMKETQE